MEEQVAQKSSELEQYLVRVKELEEMYKQLQEALEDEKQARQDEETVRRLQARSVCNLIELDAKAGSQLGSTRNDGRDIETADCPSNLCLKSVLCP